MLSFAIYYLLKNPEAMRKLREEVDTMIGQRPMTVQDVHKLPYLIGKLFTTLTLHVVWRLTRNVQLYCVRPFVSHLRLPYDPSRR